MQRPAHLGSLAARLNNLEQIVSGLEPGEGGDGTLAERLFTRILFDARVGSGAPSEPFSQYETVYDQAGLGRGFHWSIWGRDQGGGPSMSISASIASDTPLFEQIFRFHEVRFMGWGVRPLTSYVLGDAGSFHGDFAAALGSSESMPSAVFGTALDLQDFLAGSGGRGLLQVAADDIEQIDTAIVALQDRIDGLETYLNGRLDNLTDRVDGHAARISALEAAA